MVQAVISEVRKLVLPMDVVEIQKKIPHRYPFLFIDRVIDVEPFKYARATRNISISDPMLQGHFPNQPIVPGVVIVEGAAQVAALLGSISRGSLSTCLFTEIKSARFKRPVVPGDVLVYHVNMVKSRADFCWFDAVMSVESDEVATVQFSAMMKM